MTEESRFREAFAAELAAHPDTAPGPTALNLRLGKTRTSRTPLNTLNGRMNRLRKELMLEAGFTQVEKWGRWTRTKVDA
jgi:hypothetical protein